MLIFVLVVAYAAATERINWHSASGRAQLCKETGFGCKEPNATRVVELFHNRHGRLAAASLEPVVLVPGLSGSGIDASIDKNYKPAW